MKLTNNPIIKWTGSKRSQAKTIVSYFPKTINTYYEPFIGSAAVLKELLNNVEEGNITCNMFVCSDINDDLINTWNLIKYKPELLFDYYTEQYNKFKDLDIDGKKNFYNNIKNEFNKMNSCNDKNFDPLDLKYCMFFWLRRTAYNGLVRYNSKGEFNASCHFTRNGIEPEKLKPILDEWNYLLKKYDVQFVNLDYSLIKNIENNSFFYLDPPYENTHEMYLKNTFNKDVFFMWLKDKPNYILSYDGKTTEKDNTVNIPEELYTEHIYVNSGRSTFSKFKNKDVKVKESLYIKKGID